MQGTSLGTQVTQVTSAPASWYRECRAEALPRPSKFSWLESNSQLRHGTMHQVSDRTHVVTPHEFEAWQEPHSHRTDRTKKMVQLHWHLMVLRKLMQIVELMSVARKNNFVHHCTWLYIYYMHVLSSSCELAEPAKPTPWIKRYFSCPRSKKIVEAHRREEGEEREECDPV